MSNLRLALTDKNLIGLPLAHDRPYIARDIDLGGFFVVIGKTSRTFTIQADLHRADGARTSIRMAVGEVGEITSRDARIKAKALIGRIGQIGKGDDPRPPKVQKAKAPPADLSVVVVTSPDGRSWRAPLRSIASRRTPDVADRVRSTATCDLGGEFGAGHRYDFGVSTWLALRI